ncbi:MAG: DNA primase [Planctomycetes bacterium]|nr:DNA primase [Planctomycetota bacterium]
MAVQTVKTYHELLERVDIIEVVSRYIQLKKAGTNFKANCPFHGEKTPSFIASPTRQIFKCFGCQVGGNSIRFVMLIEKISKWQAAKKLAEMHGIRLDFENISREEIQRERFIKINSQVAKMYHQILLANKSSNAYKYLTSRKIAEQTIKTFEIGLATNSNQLTQNFNKLGFNEDDLIRLGLLSKTNGRLHDMFFNRIIIPIKNKNGDYLGFGARAIDDNQQPKYINSKESPIFHKGSILFGTNIINLEQDDHLYMCEGYFDVILPYQAGLKCFAATLGTALTPEHCKNIRRITENVTLVFDSDKAGKESIKRSIPILYNENINIDVSVLSKLKDPAGYIEKEMVSELKNELAHTQSCIDFLINLYTKGEQFLKLNDHDKISLVDELLSVSNSIHDPVRKDIYLCMVSSRLGIDVETLRRGYSKTREAVVTDSKEEKITASDRVILQILAIILTDINMLDNSIKKLKELQSTEKYTQWLQQIETYHNSHRNTESTNYVRFSEEIFEDSMDERLKNELEGLIMSSSGESNISPLLDDCFNRLKQLQKKSSLLEKINLMKNSSNQSEKDKFLKEIRNIKSGMVEDLQ